MSRRLLLDTNAVSLLIRGGSSALERRLEGERICISVITEAELRYGLARRPEATRLAEVVEAFLDQVEVLPWISATARRYAELRADLARRGATLSSLDLLIAAQALADHCALATADRAFRQVENLEIVGWQDTEA